MHEVRSVGTGSFGHKDSQTELYMLEKVMLQPMGMHGFHWLGSFKGNCLPLSSSNEFD